MALLFFLSGFTGLVYQVLWVRRFTHVMGSGTVSVSVVIAAFMGGLFLGAVLLMRVLRHCRHELRWYAVLEGLIGFWGLLFVWSFPHVGGIYHWLSGAWLSGGGGAGVIGLAAKATFSMLLMLLPTAAMGATLPLMVQFLARRGRGFGDAIGQLYAVNASGGAIGAMLTGFVLIEFVGIDNSLLLVGGLNLAVALSAWWLASTLAVSPSEAPAGAGSHSEAALRPLLGAAFVSGFAAIGCEVLWTRGLKFIIQSSPYSYTLILGVFLVGLGLGGTAYRRWLTRVDHQVLYGRLQTAIAAWVLLTMCLLYGLAPSAWFQESVMSLVYDSDHHWGLGLEHGLECPPWECHMPPLI